jgi:hypothetical protein
MLGLAVPVSAAAAGSPDPSAAAAGATQHAAKSHKPNPGKPKPPKPKPKPPNPKPPKGLGAPQSDMSSGMPRTMRDDLTGDFLGRGYDQRMRAEGSNLNIYDSPSRGGAQLRSTPTDLVIAGGGVDYGCGSFMGAEQYCSAFPWAQYGHEGDSACSGCFQFLWAAYELNTIYLARNNQNIFMAGTQGNGFDELGLRSGDTAYRNWLYVLPGDGSCASASCAISRIRLPDAYNLCGGCSGGVRAIQATSLAAGTIGGTPYLAVGLSDNGVQIYNVSNPSSPQLTATFTGMATGDGSQTPPTALAWDPSGSGTLAVGVISWADEGFFIHVNNNGNVQPNWLAWSQHGGDALVPAPFSAAFGQRQNGNPVVAFGMREGDGSGDVRLVDPTASGAETNQLAESSTGPGASAIIAINPIPRFDGTASGSDYAVSYQDGTNVGTGFGGLLRWDGTSSGLTFLPVTSGSPNTISPDWVSFREWYPGIKEGRFQVANTSGEPIRVGLQASANPGLGCWYAPSWADAPAFPTAGVTVNGGQTSTIYTMGAYTAGANGGCNNAADPTGTWRGYLVITPVNHPADSRLVGLRLNRDMTVDVDDQAGGGSTTVSITQTAQLAAFGLWNITVDTPAAPTPVGSPTVAAARITPADFTAGPPVYRFDVTDATYQLPTPYPNQLVLPPMQVQGSVNGTSWTQLGTLIPRTEPTIVNGANGSQLALRPATFWWENPAGQPAYQQIRVSLGPAGAPSPAITLSGLPAPPDPTNVSGPVIAATSTDRTARPVDSGLDQAPLSVQVLAEINGSTGPPLPFTDPSYQRIFYRDNNNALITNLLLTGANPNSFLGVSPYAGAYPNNGSVTSGQPGTFAGFHYVSTTSTLDQTITGYIAGGTTSPLPSAPIDVQASGISPVTSATSAANGISLATCADFTGSNLCRLFPISPGQPGLYLDTSNGVRLGMLTASPATTSAASLPLQQTAGTPQHLLVSAPLTVSTTVATLTNTSAFLASDRVDTTLVTHGLLVPVINIPAGS